MYTITSNNILVITVVNPDCTNSLIGVYKISVYVI